MTPAAFFEEWVLRAYRDWQAHPTDEYLAANAVHWLNVMADRYFRQCEAVGEAPEGATSLDGFRAILEQRCPEFGLVRDADNAKKHLVAKRKSKVVLRSDQIASPRTGYGAGGHGGGGYGGVGEVAITDDAGTIWTLSDVLPRVIDEWRAILAATPCP